MTSLDFWLFGILGLFVLNGFRSGLINMIGSLIGLVIGIVLAGCWFDEFSAKVMTAIIADPLIAQVVGFAVLTMLFSRILGLAFSIVNKALNIIKFIPGMAAINRLAGAGLGLVEGVLMTGAVLFVATKFDVSPGWGDALAGSTLTPILLGIAQVVIPLLPGALKQVQSVVNRSL